jgi:hypothetical protein
MMTEEISPELKKAALVNVRPPEDEWWIRDLTDSYPWLDCESMYWIIDTHDESAIILGHGEGKYECLNLPAQARRIGEIIAASLGSVPSEEMDAEGLAKLLTEWYRDPRGRLATPEFLEQEKQLLESWVVGTDETLGSLKGVCGPIQYDVFDEGNWLLLFNFINRKGGVEQWRVAGESDPFEINDIRIEMIKPEGSFFYPEEL